MPVAYHISDDQGLVTVRVEGAVVPRDLFESAKRLMEDNDYDHSVPLLVDLRGMQVELDTRNLRPFNEFIIENYGQRRVASIAVVIDDDVDRQLCAAVYWLSCAVPGTELFEDYEHAVRWLIRKEFASGNSL